MKLNDIEAYKLAFHLSNYVWDIVMNWGPFALRIVGLQFVNAVDSISANIAEGFGRHFKKDRIKFYHYSRGSVKECFDWNEKSKVRKLITKQEYEYIFNELDKLPKSINSLIKYTRDKLTS
ncbi:MAG TPA: four helix bundle protein [Candidatus Babeliaceae bacterium]|nr:four helix bundle protein [Candidatus Babeliaceae bacterium]